MLVVAEQPFANVRADEAAPPVTKNFMGKR
jgi:hypothetical protein